MVISRNKGTTMNDSTTPSTDDRRGEVVDIFSATPKLKSGSPLPVGTKRKLDPTQADEAWSFNAPPPMGYYDLKPMPAKDPVRWNEEYEYYSFNLECRIVSPDKDVDNIPVFATVTTKIGRGKNISTMGALITKLGFKLPDEIDDLSLCKMLAEALKKEKLLRKCLLDWSLGYKQQPSGDWKQVFSTMTQFPRNEDGTYKHKINITIGQGMTEEVTAQLKIIEWGHVNEEKAKELMNRRGKPNSSSLGSGIQLTKAASSSPMQETLVLESDEATSPSVSDVSEEDLKLVEE